MHASLWDTEQGAHGPIVLAIAVWLSIRNWPAMRAQATPGSALIGGPLLALALLAFIASHIVGSVMLQSAAVYAAAIAALYLLIGRRAIQAGWFPIFYFLSCCRLRAASLRSPRNRSAWRSLRWQSAFFHISAIQWPEGLLIYVGQYAIEVKAACSGLSSIISLTAVGLFYAYALHHLRVRYCVLLTGAAFLLAMIANLARVITVMLITYYFGNEAGQGFLHGAAGIFMFVFALLGLIFLDWFFTAAHWPQHRPAAAT